MFYTLKSRRSSTPEEGQKLNKKESDADPLSKLKAPIFHVSKIVPHKKKKRGDSSTSNSNTNSHSEDSILSSLVYSSSDTDHQHISTPSEDSSASSREIADKKSEEEQLNKKKMEKKVNFPKKPLYLDDSHLGQGKYMHVIQLQSYRMSLLPYVNADSRKDELNRQFRINFPRIRKAITLSKLRRLKMDMVKIFITNPTIIEEGNEDQEVGG